jgi:broad specificity phosphatase PhoE
MTLIFVRHGESEGNVGRVIQGWLELPLTAAGEAQAAAVARRLASAAASALYTSPLRRARQTAEAIAATTGLEVIDLADLREYCFGEAQGLTWEQAASRWGLLERDWGVGAVPGEEGMETFRARVRRQFEELHERHMDSVAIAVIHGGVFGALVASLCGLEPHEHVQLYTGNCGIMVVTHERNGDPVITTLNDLCHLRELPPPLAIGAG